MRCASTSAVTTTTEYGALSPGRDPTPRGRRHLLPVTPAPRGPPIGDRPVVHPPEDGNARQTARSTRNWLTKGGSNRPGREFSSGTGRHGPTRVSTSPLRWP